MSDTKPIARPFRLEREGLYFDVPTYATQSAADGAAGVWSTRHPGKRWRVVERLNKSGSRRRVVASSNPAEVE